MATVKNVKIREAAKANKLKLWQVAEGIGMLESAFSRMLRHELPERKQAEILEAIDRIARECVDE